MNKPAPKEPSMDEILSSIRQIIADDDAGGAPKRPSGLGASPMVQPAPPVRPALSPMAAAPQAQPEPELEEEPEPLALSMAQVLPSEDEDEAVEADFADVMGSETGFSGAELIDPEDVAFEPDPEPVAEPELDDPMAMFSVEADPEPEPAPMAPAPKPPVQIARPIAPPARAEVPRMESPRMEAASQPRPSVAQTAPMPDPMLSTDMAEQLLDSTTQSAVKSTFSKLNGLSMVGSGVTIEEMMREMLRPMLKEWLDENLPSLVERMVEREIARISRGGN